MLMIIKRYSLPETMWQNKCPIESPIDNLPGQRAPPASWREPSQC